MLGCSFVFFLSVLIFRRAFMSVVGKLLVSRGVASKLYGVDATIRIFVFVL